MKELKVYGGHVTIVDDEDFDCFKSECWCLVNNYPYCVRLKLYLHQAVMGGRKEGFIIDHIDHNKLNNQKNNLRWVTQHENQFNRQGLGKRNKSGKTGVRFNPRQGWIARIFIKGKEKHLGTFPTLEEAIQARKQAEVEAHLELYTGCS